MSNEQLTSSVAFADSATQPATPPAGYVQFSDASDRLSWVGTDGFVRTFAGTLSANRVYTLPDQSITVGSGGGAGTWGSITGTLSNQTDLQSALTALVPKTTTVNGHALSGNVTVTPTDLSLVVGTNVEAWSANLDTWSGKTPYAGNVVVTTAKTLTASNTLTLAGTDGSTLNVGTGGTLGTNAFNSTAFGLGSVTSVSVVTANGVSGSVATATTTPAITLTLAAITPTSVNGLAFTALGTGFTVAGGTTSKTLQIDNSLEFAGVDGSVLNIGSGGTLGSNAFNSTAFGTGTVTTVSVTTANGVSGTVATATTTPAITLTLGVITPTSVNGLTFVAASTGFTVAGGTTSKTLTVSNTLTLAGTDSTTMTFPTTSASIARTDAAQTFTGLQTFSTGVSAAGVTLTSGNFTTASGGNLNFGTSRAILSSTADNTLKITGSGGTTFASLFLGTNSSSWPQIAVSSAGPVKFVQGDGSTASNVWITGLLQYGGLTRTTTGFTATSNAVLANVTALTATLVAGQTYNFRAKLPMTAASSGGVQLAIAGTATATSIYYEGVLTSGGAIVNQTSSSALAGVVCSSSAAITTGNAEINGTITVNAGGTLTVQFAQNTSNASVSTVLQGATFEVKQTAN